jgi:replicative DNA helicase
MLLRESIESIRTRKGALRGVPSGFRDLDGITAGWQRSDLVILAARPAMGKTSFSLNLAENVAIEEKIPVAFFHWKCQRISLLIDYWLLRLVSTHGS